MVRGRNTHVYTGKYALVGVDGASACRMSVRAHVQLPYGDLDRWSKPIGPEQTMVRNRRVQARLTTQAAQNDQKANEKIQRRKAGSLSRKTAWTMIMVVFVFLAILLLGQIGRLAQRENTLIDLRAQIQTQSEKNIDLQIKLNEAADEVKVRYAAVQNLGMVAPKGVEAIGIVLPKEQTTQLSVQKEEIPKNSGFLASLLGFLD